MTELDVLKKILLSDDVISVLSEKENIIFGIIPELANEKGFEQKNEWHCYDVWNHTIHAVASCDKDFIGRLTLLLHDIGKPYCFQDYGKTRSFKGHAKKSAALDRIILKRLGIDQKSMDIIMFLIRNHSTSIDIVDFESDELLYNEFLKIQMCDSSAYEPRHAQQERIRLRSKKNYSII